MLMEGNNEFRENLEGKRQRNSGILRGGKKSKRGKREEKQGGFSLFQGGALLVNVSTAFATLERGLLRVSAGEAQKSCSTCGMLECNLLRLSVASMLKRKVLRLSISYDQQLSLLCLVARQSVDLRAQACPPCTPNQLKFTIYVILDMDITNKDYP